MSSRHPDAEAEDPIVSYNCWLNNHLSCESETCQCTCHVDPAYDEQRERLAGMARKETPR